MKLTLIEKKQEVPGVTSFVWKPEADLEWIPGQFLHYVLPHEPADERGTERWFTVSAAPFEGHAMLTTRHADEHGSSFKERLFAIPVGGTIDADTPEGDFLYDGSTPAAFIAGGIGITPYRAILMDLDHRGADIDAKLMYANRNDDFIFKDELEALAARHPKFKIHYFTADERIDEAAIEACVPDRADRVFYASGPEPMVEALEKIVLSLGIPDGQFKRDFFPGYLWP